MQHLRQIKDNKNSYTRKNAIIAIRHIYLKHRTLIPDAPNIIHSYLVKETDDQCKMNCLLMLLETDPSLAVAYLSTVADEILLFEEPLQCAVAECARHLSDNRITDEVVK